MEFPARFLDKISPEPNTGCWLWTAQTSIDGYARFAFRGGQLGHRFAYEVANGAIPGDLQIDHLCRQRCCVNPDHLEAVTQKENMRRGLKGALTTHCPHGHEYTPENTTDNGRGGRVCRECKRIDGKRRNTGRPLGGAVREFCKRGHLLAVTARVNIRTGKRQCGACATDLQRARRRTRRAGGQA